MTRRVSAGTLGLGLLATLGGYFTLAADGPKRVPWTTSKVVGTPDPAPPFMVTEPFPRVRLKSPLHVTFQADLGRVFVTEQGGAISSFVPRPDATPEVFFDPKGLKQLAKTPNQNGFETVYGLAFHPKFAANRQCFICYTLRGKDGVSNLPDGTRVSRFAVTVNKDAPPKVDPASEVILLTFLQGGHNGGDLHFGPDGMLYISTGDTANPTPPDPLHTGQDISDLLSSVLRINVNKVDPGKAYAIPPDNPFVGVTHAGKPARGEVWSYGYRNPWRMSFDKKTGELWVGDVGWELWELVHKATRGSNHGWSRFEGRQTVNTQDTPGPTPVVPPAVEVPHTAGASVTGGYVYRGKKFPELVGKYVFGDWESRRIWAATPGDAGKPAKLDELVRPSVRVVAFGEDNDGELLFLDYDAGTVHSLDRLTRRDHDPSKFPRTLTATGLFAEMTGHRVAPGVRKFEVASPQWQGYATSEHFLALPPGTFVTDHEGKKPIPGNVNWHHFHYHFPAGAVLVKTISLEHERGNPGTRRRVETQLLHFDGETWNAYTYAWRDDQSDADLVPADGAEKHLSVRDPAHAGGVRHQTWSFGSRAQCFQCHNAWAESTLAFNVEQLNRSVGGRNQLAELCDEGTIRRVTRDGQPRPALTDATAAKEPKLTNPSDAAAPIAARVKSYLHANCGHCHRFGGGGAVDFELHLGANLRDKKLAAPPARGTFDIPDAKLLAPGDPGRSVLLYRMAKFGGGRMPHLGAELPDPLGLALVRDWLHSLQDGSNRVPGVKDVPAAVLSACRYPGAPPVEQAALREQAGKLPPGPMRDLFAGYLPQTGERKLGPNPKPDTVLALTGDSARGAVLFAQTRSQCLNCHQVAGAGKNVGPDLSAIGKLRTREHILESVLQPSKQIDAAYKPYLLRTHDGRSLTGTLVRKTAAEVVLKTADGTEVRVEADNVEALEPGKESLMPAGLFADFTPQEAADVVAYLAGRK